MGFNEQNNQEFVDRWIRKHPEHYEAIVYKCKSLNKFCSGPLSFKSIIASFRLIPNSDFGLSDGATRLLAQTIERNNPSLKGMLVKKRKCSKVK